MISKQEFYSNIWGSAILMASLLLCLVWYPSFLSGENFTHPFVYLEDGTFGPLEYPAHKFWTMLAEIVCVLSFLIAHRISPKMVFSRLGDLWHWYYTFQAAKIIDFCLTYRTSDFRLIFTFLLIFIQGAFLIYQAMRTEFSSK